MRTAGQKLIVYATGSHYDWQFLQQLSVRAGNGSFMHHALTVDDMQGHIFGELAFMRGTVLTDVVVRGRVNRNAKLKNVTRFVPVRHALEKDDVMNEPLYLDPRGSFSDVGFANGCGALDRMRGQRFYLEIEFDLAKPGNNLLLTLQILGKDQSGLPFVHQLDTSIIFTRLAPTQPAHPEVKLVQGLIAAEELAKVFKYKEAQQVYKDLGQTQLAGQMETLIQSLDHGYSREETSRGATSVCSSATSSLVLPPELRRAMSGQVALTAEQLKQFGIVGDENDE